MLRFLSTLSFLLVLLALPAAGTAAELIADLHTGQEPSFQEILDLLPLGDRAVAVTHEESSGSELWATDGTSAGTEILRDLCSGSCSSYPAPLGAIGTTGLFLASGDAVDGSPRGYVLRSDGTRQGTRVVTANGPAECEDRVDSAALAGAVLFSGRAAGGGCRLWRTDGTADGTHPLSEPSAAGSLPKFLTAAGGRVFFAEWAALGGTELWRSDGTAGGTVPVKSFPGLVSALLAAGPDVLFLVRGDTFSELWRSDGTASGTVRVAAFDDPDAFDRFHTGRLRAAQIGNRVFFLAWIGTTGERMWTSAGPSWQAAPLAGCPGACPQAVDRSAISAFGGRVLFAAYGPDRAVELWSTAGAGSGTRKVATLCQAHCANSPTAILPLLGQAYFLAGPFGDYGLWRTDGTATGTLRIATQRFDSQHESLRAVQVGGRFVFAGDDGVLGPELWASDGTADGTAPLTLLSNAPSSDPAGFIALGDRVAFHTAEELSTRLWLSDGTAAGTVQLGEMALYDRPTGTTAAGLLFFLKSHANGNLQLWRTDGTQAGTIPLTTGGIQALDPVTFGAKVVMPASPGGGVALWESDGTAAGTDKLFDLPAEILGIQYLSAVGPELYFVANGWLFRSDGTAAGTRQVTTAAHGAGFATPPRFARAGAQAFFTSNGRILWRTDGTAAGTLKLLDLPSIGDIVPEEDLAELQGSLLVIARNGLWKSDGTVAGTVLLKAFTPTAAAPVFARHDGRLYFNASDGEHGVELWSTDGTAAGTVLVSDISPGAASSNPRDLASAGGRLYFNAGDEEHGRELWESDGTEEGTRLVQDIAPGALSSDPAEMTAAGGKLFFAADDLLSGREPWVHLLSDPGCQPAAETLCLGGGRFRVEASWRDFQGNEGRGQAVTLTADTGYFWFFDPANVEVILKALDGRDLNGHHWIFYGALSTVEYTLTVTDTQTGAARRYVNPPGRLSSVGDTRAFGPLGAHAPALALDHEPIVRTGRATAATCEPTAARLCLQGGRFAVEARWTDFQGNHGVGKAVNLSGDTGYFWFFDEANVEVVLKVLDGRPLNGKHWVFFGALSSVDYTLTVTDTETGKTRTYHNPPGRLASVADTSAF